jgi:putative ABC transport system permease protein
MSALILLYRLLLLAYPREIRERHSAEASRLFAEACTEDWRTRGARAAVRRIAAAVVDVPRAGLAERSSTLRAAFSWSEWYGLSADIRHAAKSFRGRPALTLTIVATLAIGLGTAVAVFSVVDATLLRPLPFPHANRVVLLEAANAATGRTAQPRPSWARTWTAGTQSLERIEWRVSRSALVTGAGPATRVRVMDASGGYLNAIRARPILGRSIDQNDTAASAPRVAVLSEPFWRQRFGASSGVLGTSIAIDGVSHTVVGVTSDLKSDIAGLTFSAATALHSDDDRELVRAVAWLTPGVTLDAAQTELDAAQPINDGGRTLHPRLTPPKNLFWTIPVFRATELGLMASALLILAVAGVNLSHLFLASGQERSAELAVRRALGASTIRVARLLFVETMALALVGSLAGLAVAWALIRAVKSLNAGVQLQTRIDSIRLDPLIVAFAIGLACLLAVAFGLWPAIRSARDRSLPVNVSSTRSSRRRGLSSAALMAAETGFSAAVLIVAGVVGHVFLSMQLAPRGFDADRILRVRVTLPAERYATPASRDAFFERLGAEAASIPGVEGFGIGYEAPPPSDFFTTGAITVAGSGRAPVETTMGYSFVAPGYFSLVGIPLLQGTGFAASDVAAARAADGLQPAVISRSVAQRFLPNGGAVGASFELKEPNRVRHFSVLGVAGDVSQWGLLSPGCHDCDPLLYLPLPERRMYTDVLVRLRAGAAPPVAALQAAITKLDPEVPADDELRTAAAGVNQFIDQPRFMAALFGAFALVAVILLSVGLSTVVARSVAQRTREMGIRLALGATPRSVRLLVVSEGMRPALIGLAGGIAAALAITRAIRSLLYGMSPADPWSLTLAPLLLLTVVLAALTVPALRATRVDPARTLRAD